VQRILVTGGAGYLGSELRRQAPDALATWHRAPLESGIRLDVRDDEAVHRVLLKHGPDVVIHTAYVMDDAETITRGSRNVALAAHRVGARLIHLSTDLVFDGEQGAPYAEDAEPRPVSAYGQSKLEAEALVRSHHPEALVVRTSLLYGTPGPQEALAQRDDVVFHTDEIRCPTRVDELAAALLELSARNETGILHVAAPDAVSRLELARLLGARDPRGVPTPAGRARNVALDSSRAATLLATKLRGVNAATLD
jgi:dTDP-4-dehydrorhamnose reductase